MEEDDDDREEEEEEEEEERDSFFVACVKHPIVLSSADLRGGREAEEAATSCFISQKGNISAGT